MSLEMAARVRPLSLLLFRILRKKKRKADWKNLAKTSEMP